MSEADPSFDRTKGGDPTDERNKESFASQGDPTDEPKGGESNLSDEEIEQLRKRDQHAQEHIRRLEAERREQDDAINQLRSELERRPTMEEVVERMRENRADEPAHDEPKTKGIDEDELVRKVAEVVPQVLSQKEKAEATRRNLTECMDQAKEHYGDEFVNEVGKLAGELGMSLKEVDELAAQKPAAFKRLFIQGDKQVTKERHNGFVPSGSERVESERQPTRDVREDYRKGGHRKFFTPDNFDAVRAQIKNKG